MIDQSQAEDHVRQLASRALEAHAPARAHVDTEARAKALLEYIRGIEPANVKDPGPPPEKTQRFAGQD